MQDIGPDLTFLGLPLTAEQESEVQHYIHQRARRGLPCDSQELKSMLSDMLDPPVNESYPEQPLANCSLADVERAASLTDDSNDPISAWDDRTAAREGEAMKHPDQ
jgi:hypothetical protein